MTMKRLLLRLHVHFKSIIENWVKESNISEEDLQICTWESIALEEWTPWFWSHSIGFEF